MGQSLSIMVRTELPAASFITNAGNKRQAKALEQLFSDLGSGARNGSVQAYSSVTDGAAASQTITCDQSAATSADVVAVLGVDLTEGTAFDAETSDAVTATNLAAAINANATLAKYVTATSAAAVVTVTANFKGSSANYWLVSTATVDSGTPFVFSNSGAFASGAGGIEGDATAYSLGLSL